ncbi:RNA-directed DNA polymerase, eukaryota, reverse transcriptase zinc-binding domain protein, partial [Tanacetum coccineum]
MMVCRKEFGGCVVKNGMVIDEVMSQEPIENCNVNTKGKVDESQVEVNSEPASSDLPKVAKESDEAVMNDIDMGKEKHENSNGNSSHKATGKEGIKISYANIASKNNLDNKLNLIPTEINEDGVEVDPSVSLDKTEPNKLPLWVRLWKLPLEAWITKGISDVASRLGNPLIMDQTTANMCKTGYGRVGFARVLIDERRAPKSVDEFMEMEREELRNKQDGTEFEQV